MFIPAKATTTAIVQKLAVAIDATVILAGAGVFGGVFLRVSEATLKPLQLGAGLAGLLGLLWATYQFLLIVYSGTTPGMRCLKLQVRRFDGNRPSRRLR